MAGTLPVVCDSHEGCGTVRVLAQRVSDQGGRLEKVEKEQEVLHTRITDGLRDKIIEYRWVIGLVVVQLGTMLMAILNFLKTSQIEKAVQR